MRTDALPSPGLLSNGVALRNEAAKAISAAQIGAYTVPSGKSRQAAALAAFFTACAAACSAIGDSTAPAVNSRTRNSATQITVAFSEILETSTVPAATAFTVSAGGVVTSVAVSGLNVVLTGTGFTVGATVAYTAPAASALRDRPGNLIANFSGVLA